MLVYILVPEPINVKTSDIKESRALVSWTIPSSPLKLQNIELELNKTDGSSSVIMDVKPDVNSKLLTDLVSGTPYSARLRSIAADGRTSDWSSPAHVFITGEITCNVFAVGCYLF